MAKKTPRGKKRAKPRQVDLIPKHSQQRRSPGRQKRRTDFSPFFCFFSSSTLSDASRRGGLLVDASNGDGLRSAIGAGYGENGENRNQLLETQGISSSNEFPVDHERARHNAVNGRNMYGQTQNMVDKVKLTNAKSKESNASCTVPGSLIWAKNSHQQWWPAKVLEERSSSVDSEGQGLNGYVLVQYYGNNESAWVDPTTDVSLFDSFFEERSCNPVKEFQDALQQALQQRRILNSGKQSGRRTPTKQDSLSQPSESPDNRLDSRSSRTESDAPDRRRGKRERKPRVHFDEECLPVKSTKVCRRIKIMRFLGLAAPIGSPFTTLPSM
ncbi:uncharacterized protein LOC124938755 [Impatiens glandulifera]|uniref:uncharacterized protein LOC124938755 n=1 Tax=Impatiens glandulifera TaxID=253017 RepID=UPI001FB0C769|nr:uncharacterized protein LOC124938755 [Impatiens glandulifera]